MSLYSRILFPRLCHLALSGDRVARIRRRVLAAAEGDVLELGFGTGLNFPRYPRGIRSLTAVDPNPGMHRLAGERCDEAPVEPRLLRHGAEALPFDDASFDSVVSTWTLCSVAALDRALAEARRVLRPGGRLSFVEHGLSPRPWVARLQRWLTPLQRRVADGCHLDRDFERLLGNGGFHLCELERSRLPGTPELLGHLYLGTARPAVSAQNGT